MRASRAKRATLRVGCEVRREDLDRDVAPQLAVARAIDLAHAAGAERREDRVWAELTAHHHRFSGRTPEGEATASAAGVSRNRTEADS